MKEEELDVKPEIQDLKMEMKVESLTATEFKFEGKRETLYSDEEEVPKEDFVMEVDVPKEVAKKDEDSMSIDEFDVEAQMMKLTGDDGNDYKEKAVEPLSERFKNVDGIEGLMESSKEDSESERELEDDEEEKEKEQIKIREREREVEKEREREMEKMKELERQKEEKQRELEKQQEIEKEIERMKEMEEEKIEKEMKVEIDMFEEFEEKKMCPVEALEELKVMADSTPAER